MGKLVITASRLARAARNVATARKPQMLRHSHI
jgi:hypothetical protein